MNNQPQHSATAALSARARFGSDTCWNCGEGKATQQTEFLKKLEAYGWGSGSRVIKSFAKIPTCDACVPKVAQASKAGLRYRGRGIMPTMVTVILLCVLFTIAVPFITIPVAILAGVVMFSVYRADVTLYRPYHERLLGDSWESAPEEEEPIQVSFVERWWRVGAVIVVAVMIVSTVNMAIGSTTSIILLIISGLLLSGIGISHFLPHRWGRGMVFLLAGVNWILAGVFASPDTMIFFVLGLVLTLAVAIWSIADAIQGTGV